ncbi:hypothetical protein [Streptomyces stelliscabiei]|uniref:hypothetical protein n=1 Tax=Streptomyces stelliscabiei TaxID=146820 RepID=UPI0029BBA619|nr:hypothetical protein [Streptomyces stelliscabiei]MDX2515921.1 hypothetical protein [Streptomyces stelliscabiei]MDX2549507.1 hypothetical protein [Streptomyces stelliscabiei]MDX2611529.1 hypothetical protein [Streptomyces stelliscabiei]MDX2634375.1 hypothetical protein [Streptomyces stelliscabiei]MDX2659321.1 hypothetical protein [Streptomyces stelliscabiei]
MTRLPFILDRVSDVLAVEPPKANQHHLLILDIAEMCHDLDEQLDALVGDHADGVLAIAEPKRFTRLLAERLSLEVQLTQAVSQSCCCATETASTDNPEDNAEGEPGGPGRPETIVHACLDAFAAAGDPPALLAADIVDHLRALPGSAEGPNPYVHLTQGHLGRLLAVHTVHPCSLSDGRGKGYRRSALTIALYGYPC